MFPGWCLISVAVIAFIPVADAGSVIITKSNFNAHVIDSGKSGFVKFMAPWCGHCKSMKTSWEELGDQYAESSSVIIGDVDCTVESELCSDHGVRGYPTLKYFPVGGGTSGMDYSGSRDKVALQKFIDDTLVIPNGARVEKGIGDGKIVKIARCNVDTHQGCSTKEINFIETILQYTPEKRQDITKRLEQLTDDDITKKPKDWIAARLSILRNLD